MLQRHMYNQLLCAGLGDVLTIQVAHKVAAYFVDDVWVLVHAELCLHLVWYQAAEMVFR